MGNGADASWTNHLSNLAKLTGLIVGLLYAIGWLLAGSYYRTFGLSTTGVGLSSADLVGQAGGAAIWLVLLTMPSVLLAGALAVVLRLLPRLRPFTARNTWHLFASAVSPAAILVAAAVTPIAALNRSAAGDAAVPLLAIVAGSCILGRVCLWPGHGQTHAIYAEGSNGAVRLVVLLALSALLTTYTYQGFTQATHDVTSAAHEAKHGTIDESAPWSLAPKAVLVRIDSGSTDKRLTTHCLVDLGQNSSLLILYDPTLKVVWRVPATLDLIDLGEGGCAAGATR